jgi:hypothetical protein
MHYFEVMAYKRERKVYILFSIPEGDLLSEACTETSSAEGSSATITFGDTAGSAIQILCLCPRLIHEDNDA